MGCHDQHHSRHGSPQQRAEQCAANQNKKDGMGLAPVPVELLDIVEQGKENNIQIRQRTEKSPPKEALCDLTVYAMRHEQPLHQAMLV